jgi:septal ring factor EnvC (AmiA/AmiB activator)
MCAYMLQDHLAALMEVNEENETLMKQYDREKQRRKEIEEKSMRQEDVSEGEVRELKSQMARVQSENRGMGSKLSSQREQIDRLEERCEDLLKEKKQLHDKNIGLIKNFHDQMESLSARRMSETRRKMSEEGVSSPTRPRGFQDFMSPAAKAGRKKRTLPIAPHRRNKGDTDEEEEVLLGVTPSQRPDSPEYSRGDGVKTPPNLRSLHEEQTGDEEEGEEGYEEDPEGVFQVNEDSLLDELHLATTGSSATGVDQIITENEELMTAKNQLTREVDDLTTKLTNTQNDKRAAETELVAVQTERDGLSARTAALEGEVKRLRRELEDEKEKTTQLKEAEEKNAGDGLRLTKLEVARVLRERNEYKEKYLSLLEQVRMNDELLFKKSKKSSRWVDYFAALFSPAKRRQLEKVLDGTPRRSILGARNTPDIDEEDGGEAPQAGPAGYSMTHTIPTLRRGGKRQEELLMTSVSWLTPPSTAHHSHQSELQTLPAPLLSPGINTCRPMSFQEDGAKVLCATAVNPATFLSDHSRAITVAKHVTPPPEGVALEKGRPPVNIGVEGEGSMSLVWIITGVPNLTKVSVLDAAAMGEILETFIVSSTPIECITGIPAFDENDPDVLTSLSSARRRRSNAVTESTPSVEESGHQSDIPSSRHATMWMGSDQGV